MKQKSGPKRKRFWTRGRVLVYGTLALVLILPVIEVVGGIFTPTREAWYEHQVKRLRQLEVTPEMLAAAAEWWPLGESYYLPIREREGAIRFENGAWVYVVFHSFHEVHPVTPRPLRHVPVLGRLAFWGHRLALALKTPVSDAILAIDYEGRFYTSDAHVCGGLLLRSAGPVGSLKDFLQTTVGALEKDWKPLAFTDDGRAILPVSGERE